MNRCSSKHFSQNFLRNKIMLTFLSHTKVKGKFNLEPQALACDLRLPSLRMTALRDKGILRCSG